MLVSQVAVHQVPKSRAMILSRGVLGTRCGGEESSTGSPEQPVPCLSVTEKVLLAFTELIESAMYLYRATGDPTLLELGRDAVESIEKISKVECGFATVSVSGAQGVGSVSSVVV